MDPASAGMTFRETRLDIPLRRNDRKEADVIFLTAKSGYARAMTAYLTRPTRPALAYRYRPPDAGR